MERFSKRFMGILVAALVWGVLAVAGSVVAEEPEPPEDKNKVFEADKGPNTVDVSGYPEEIQAAYKLFTIRCSKCHTLARPINTNMTADSWKRYVKRMANKPDSGISPDQAKQIFSFLTFRQTEKDKKKGDGK